MRMLDTLSEKEKAAIIGRRAYKRAWRAKNPEKVKAANERFYAKYLADKQALKAENE